MLLHMNSNIVKLCLITSASRDAIPVASRVYIDGIEDLLLLLLHLDRNVEAPAGPAEHLCQQYGLNNIQSAILACTKCQSTSETKGQWYILQTSMQ